MASRQHFGRRNSAGIAANLEAGRWIDFEKALVGGAVN
jgi:hypothetical protein